MRNKTMTKVATALCALALIIFVGSPAFSKNEAKEKTKADGATEKATYLVTSPHTQEECLEAIDKVAEKGAENLDNWRWGCMAGDHTGYAFFKAESEESALLSVPEMVRTKARAQKVGKFTVDQIKQAHETKSQSKK
jgi:hypothetical protein